MTRALITGINGQDGSYLAEQLLAKGVKVHGLVRREAREDAAHRLCNIAHILDKITLHVGAVDNQLTVDKLIAEIKPDQCYHLAASSFVSHNFDDETAILHTNFNATHYLLSSIKAHAPRCRFYLAASSELFGAAEESPQNERSRFNPRSMYGISKLASYHLMRHFRDQQGLFACAGLMYNHESPRRGFEFVTRKITSTVAKIHLGLADSIELGNLDAKRDWGYAPDYVRAMQAMLSQDAPEDYVIATGKLHSVREFLELAFSVIGKTPEGYVKYNSSYVRASETVPLCGDTSKANNNLKLNHTKNLKDIVKEMVEQDVRRLGGAL